MKTPCACPRPGRGQPFCAVPAWPGPTGRIAASLSPSEFPEIGAAPGDAGMHAGHSCREVAWRSKPEGRDFLSLSRLVRRRKRAGRSADDAGLTLQSFLLATPAEPGSANPISSPVRSGEAEMAHGTAAWSVDEAAKPHVHYQANR